MGVVSVILKFVNVNLQPAGWHYAEQVAIVPFLLLCGYMIYACLKKDKK